MTDITLCSGGQCPQRTSCFRFLHTLTDSLPYRQSYFTKPPYMDGALGDCDYFLPGRATDSSDAAR